MTEAHNNSNKELVQSLERILELFCCVQANRQVVIIDGRSNRTGGCHNRITLKLVA